jgi:hypothetical protein
MSAFRRSICSSSDDAWEVAAIAAMIIPDIQSPLIPGAIRHFCGFCLPNITFLPCRATLVRG